MKISEMIEELQLIKTEHGDLELYTYNAWATISKYSYPPTVNKIYSQKWEDAEHMRNELSSEGLEIPNEELFDVDLSKPIIIGVVI